MCISFKEPQFFVATANKIAKVLIDPNPGPKCLVSKIKYRFFSSDQVKATALTYTELKGSDDEVEGFFGIATSDFNFLIIRLTPEG